MRHVLGRILRRLPLDFESRYGYRPLLVESYADAGYDGICLRGANFVRVGETAGRGRQDRDNRHGKSVKTVFLYALRSDWRRRLGVPWVDHAPSLDPGSGLDAHQWAENEFGLAPLGDRRLTRRLVQAAQRLSVYPGSKINAHSKSDRTAMNAFYRLIESPWNPRRRWRIFCIHTGSGRCVDCGPPAGVWNPFGGNRSATRGKARGMVPVDHGVGEDSSLRH